MTEEKNKKNNKETEEKTQSDKTPIQVELEEKSKLIDEYLDQLQRLQAEFENYRKRVVKEKEEFRKYAIEGFAFSLLDVIDNIQRAIDATKQNHSYESLVDGISIVEKQFIDILRAQGVKPCCVNAGDIFDPHKHHAVSKETSSKEQADSIIKVLQCGYEIGDRILRPTMVMVSSGPETKVKAKDEKDINK
jgi:molecular chaperone GrpE